MGDSSLSVISAYVWPNSSWDPYNILKVRAFFGGHILIYGDSSAHYSIWGGNHESPCGRALMNVLVLGDLVALNDGYTTYSRPGSRPSILDLTITTTDMSFTWTLEQGSWGSDHIPIQLRGRHSRLKSKRTRSIIISNKFRSSMELSKLVTLRSNLLSVMQKRREKLDCTTTGLRENAYRQRSAVILTAHSEVSGATFAHSH